MKLLLNGKERGSQSVPESAKLIAQFDVPYASGELRAVAFKDGGEIASFTYKTVSKPARLKLKLDRETIRPGREELSFATMQITDDGGEPIPDIVRRIDFHVVGAGELATVGNANPKDVASFRQPTCRTFRGRYLAVLRGSGHEGAITLQAKSDGLIAASTPAKCSSH